MRFPLFISAKPFPGLNSCKVLVGKGKWQVVHTDAETDLEVYVNDLPLPVPHEPFSVVTTSRVHARCGKSGSKFLDVHVETTE